MKKPYDSIRIFKSDFCEFFTHVHPITPLLIWVPVLVYFLYRASAVDRLSGYSIGSLWALGLFFWTLAEYFLHRYVFHYPAEGRAQEWFQFLIHGLHHADPVDPTRLVMPPFAGVILAVLFYSSFKMFLGPLKVDPFFSGFLVGYLCYDYIHYSVHHFTPRTRLGKLIKQHHMVHHFVAHEARWGVSSPIWDHVFGTIEERKRPSPGRAV